MGHCITEENKINRNDSVSRKFVDYWDVALCNLAWREKTRNAYRRFEKTATRMIIWLFYYCALITEIIYRLMRYIGTVMNDE
jgi:hypothetical protein